MKIEIDYGQITKDMNKFYEDNKQMLIEEFGNDEETIRNACMLYAGLKQGFLNSMK